MCDAAEETEAKINLSALLWKSAPITVAMQPCNPFPKT